MTIEVKLPELGDGIESGDVIVGIEGHRVNSVSELQEWVARHRPGATIKVSYLRDGLVSETVARLKSFSGNEEMVKEEVMHEIEGATFENVPYKTLNQLELEGGVRVKDLRSGKWKSAGVEEGFIIVYIDKILVEDVQNLNRILTFKKGGILVEGYTPSGEQKSIGVQW